MNNDLVNYLYKEKYASNCLNLCKKTIVHFIDEILEILYPQMGSFHFKSSEALEQALLQNQDKLGKIITCISRELHEEIDQDQIIKGFYNGLLKIENELTSDAKFMQEADNASKSLNEIIICYPGFYAIAVYRIAHYFYLQNVPLLPRILTEIAHGKTGIDIHPGAQIQAPIFIDHGTGIVIGETTIIGKRCQIFQGVTLGATSAKPELRNKKRHPTIEDNCIIYANATILGGKTIIGENSIIGGNVWIIKSVEKNSQIFKQME